MAQLLGQVAVGTTLKLSEDGASKEYIVVHQGLPSSIYDGSCRGTWLLRKDIIENRVWDEDDNCLETSDIHSWLNSTMLGKYGAEIQAVIKQVKVPYRYKGGKVGSGAKVMYGANGLSCKVFLLSGYELGYTEDDSSYIPTDGAKLDYFDYDDDDKRVMYLNGARAEWFTRSPMVSSSSGVVHVSISGKWTGGGATNESGIRPAIILDTNLIVDDSSTITGSAPPNPPASISVPTSAVPSGSSIAVSWAAAANATSYTLQRRVDGGSWQTVYTGPNTNFSDTAGAWTQVQYQVAASAYGLLTSYVSSSVVTILQYNISSMTVPAQIMAGQNIPISWAAVSGVDTYILERSADSGGWTQIYSGSGTSYTDTAGDWSSVQYRAKAGKNGLYGSYKTSGAIAVIPASALVISGTDKDLGILTADVPYTVSSDTGNGITLTISINGVPVSTSTVESNAPCSIPVQGLPTGKGTILLSASVQTSKGPASTSRTLQYEKRAATFPGAGSVSQLQLRGENHWPLTLAEAVLVPLGWGGTLDKALEKLLPLVSAAVVSVGTYEGTGTFGADYPNTLTLDDDQAMVTIYGGGKTLTISSDGQDPAANISGNTATWYSEESAAEQMNTDGVTYSYVSVRKQV